MNSTPLDIVLDLAEVFREREVEDWPVRPSAVEPSEGTVAIVGRGTDRVLTPWGSEGYEFWGLNDQPRARGYAPIDCYNRWFQLHPPAYMEQHYPQGLGDLKRFWGASNGIPLYMDRHYEEYPDSVPYPRDEVDSQCPLGGYHVSSFDWMVALAVLEGWKRIELYGTDFFTFPTIMNGEPVSARPCLEYWLGVAAGRGAEIGIHQRGDLFKTIHVAVYRSELQYGFEREPAHDLSSADSNWSDVR